MKKNYVVSVKTPEDWGIIHDLLTQDGTLEDNIPNRACECTDKKIYSRRRSTYLLDESEVELLKNNTKVASVEIDSNFHFEERQSIPPPAKLTLRDTRYISSTKHYRDSQGVPGSATSAELDRTGYQILRMVQKSDPWEGSYDILAANYEGYGNDPNYTDDYRTSTVKQQSITYTDDGSDIDLVISDNACWMAHPEFVEGGISQVRDLVLDGPYFLDPSAFSGGDIITYLGRQTCTETAAKAWWSTPANRSAQFQSFSAITIGTNYTRANICGSDSAYANYGNHGTACAAQAYGKNFGWAFNSNKWFIAYGFDSNTISTETHWDIIKIFHDYKPDNQTHGDKNPLVVSTSWGWDDEVSTVGTNYINYRGTSTSYTSASIPECVYNLNNYPARVALSLNSQNLYYACQLPPSTETAAAEDLADDPRIFIFNASGNTNQKITYSGESDYNNYWNNTNSTPTDIRRYFNRIGYPGNVGANVDSPNKYLTFSVGAINDSVIDDGGVLKEQRVDYSNCGSGVDIYTPANRTLSANNDPTVYDDLDRYDPPAEISYLNISAGDVTFAGTSAACPVAAGFYACFLQRRRNWSALKLKRYIYDVLEPQDSSKFYIGTESSTVNDSNFNDYSTLEGGVPRVPYLLDPPSITITSHPQSQTIVEGNSVTFSVTATQNSITGTLSYQWQRSTDGGSTWNNLDGETSNSYTFTTSSGDNGYRYRTLVSGTGGVDDTYSNAALITITGTPSEPLPTNVKLRMSGNLRMTGLRIS